jgi:hypothetical protein
VNRLIILSITAIMANSCAFHSGMMTGNAEISSNSEIIGFATGKSKTSLVFGIGGLDSQTLVRDAKRDMYSKYPLKQGQAYANVTVDWQKAFYFIVVVNTLTISADIVDLERKGTGDGVQAGFNNIFESVAYIKSDLWLQPGDSALLIVSETWEEVVIREVKSENKVFVTTTDKRILKANLKQLYTKNPRRVFQNNDFKVNDTVQYKILNKDGGIQKVPAVVKGINPDRVLLKYGSTLIEVKSKQLLLNK